MNDSKLVEPDSFVPVADFLSQCRRHRVNALAGVDDDEIIAKTVHFQERNR